MQCLSGFVAASLIVAAGSALSQQTIHVPGDIPTLTLALNTTASGLQPGDTIELAEGSYAGSFEVSTPGITIRAAVPREVTVDAFSIDSVFTVDAPGAPVTFEGLVIRRGSNTGSNGGGINVIDAGGIVIRDCAFELNTAAVGAAIYCVVGSLTIEDSDFTDNTADVFGGAIRSSGLPGVGVTITGSSFTRNAALSGNGGAIDHAGSGASLTLADTTFSSNTSSGDGGAVFSVNAARVSITDCTFQDNAAVGGAGGASGAGVQINATPDVRISRSTFARNVCPGVGGGLRLIASTGTVVDCDFNDNRASGGAGMQVISTGANIQVYNSRFVGNRANETGSFTILGGGGLLVAFNSARVDVYNSLFDGNTSFGGGGINATQSGRLNVYNSTFVNNIADTSAGAVRRATTDASVVINNSIAFGNFPVAAQIAISGPGTDLVNYSLVEGGYTEPGVGNIDADPMFADPSNGDYSLLPGSPAIDAGSSVLYIGGPLSDLAGNDRGQDDPATPDTGEAVIGAVIDMGAFEFTPACTVDCPADQNFDGVLSPADFNSWIINYNNGCG